MKYVMMVRSKPSGDILSKHEKLTSFLSALKSPWGAKEGAEIPQVKDPGTLPMRQVNLSKCFPKGIKALVSYQNRKYVLDEGRFDDYLVLEFDPTKFDYKPLATSDYLKYLEAFGAYRGHIGDEEFIHLDFESSRGVDYRGGVYRIHPVCYFDRELCERAFRLSPEVIAQRLVGAVEGVRVVANGVAIIASSRVLTIEEANSLGDRLKSLLA
jgi:hypothetical protein